MQKIVEIIDGDRGKNYPSKSDFSEEGHTVFFNAGNITKNGISFRNKQYITKEKSDSLGNGKVNLNDIVLTTRGTVGNIVLYSKEILEQIPAARINSGMIILRTSNKNNPEFIKEYLNSNTGKRQINSMAFGSAQPQLTKRDISKFKIKVPIRREQDKIAKLLSRINKIITLEQDKISSYKHLRESILQKMFPMKDEYMPSIRFEGFNDKWIKQRLSTIVSIVGGGTPSTKVPGYWEGNINWFTPSEIGNNVYMKDSSRKITKLGLEKSSAKILPKNKTILFTSRAGIGKTAILKKKASTNQGFQSLVVNERNDVYFLYSMTNNLKKEAMRRASGSTFLEISAKDMKKINIKIPTISEQSKIGLIFKNIDKIITLSQKKSKKYEMIKKLLLQNLFI